MGVGITVEHLNAFYGKTQALFDVNITVLANHATALIGPSGCGKSTFIRCLNRMHETIPEARVEGKVHIGDLSVYNGTSATQLRRRVGMVFQKPNPFPTMSIYDNVAAGLKLNGFRNRKQLEEVVQKSLQASALWDEVKDQLHKKSGASLSGGQQQRSASPALWPFSRKCCSWTNLARPLTPSPPARSKNYFSAERAIHNRDRHP